MTGVKPLTYLTMFDINLGFGYKSVVVEIKNARKCIWTQSQTCKNLVL